MTTSYITHADCLRHEMGPGHPECPERLVAVNEHMRSSGLLDQLRVLDAPLASEEDLKRVHHPEYVDLIWSEQGSYTTAAAAITSSAFGSITATPSGATPKLMNAAAWR